MHVCLHRTQLKTQSLRFPSLSPPLCMLSPPPQDEVADEVKYRVDDVELLKRALTRKYAYGATRPVDYHC